MKSILLLVVVLSVLSISLSTPVYSSTDDPRPVVLSLKQQQQGFRVALLAGGCFWCLEPPYENLDGVIEATVGYCGGKAESAEYYQVSSGATNHLETVRLVYNPEELNFETILDIYWRFIDPTDSGGQYDDRGQQYTTAIFYHDEMQRKVAERSKATLIASRQDDKPIATKILPACPFYLAEPRHQNFYEKHYSPLKKMIKK